MKDWTPCDAPDLLRTKGRFVQLSQLDAARDGAELFSALAGGPAGGANEELWRYIPFGPPENTEALVGVLAYMAEAQGWQTLVFRSIESDQMLGTASYMRIRPEAGSCEVGCVVFSKTLQKTPAATEAMFLMARHLFEDRGYRRYEWKCDNDNAASKRAASRFGFRAEGVFRQDMVVKGKNRDTAWFSMLDHEWPHIRAAFEAWLSPANFDATGAQERSLAAIREELV